jgi:hypothetical protein
MDYAMSISFQVLSYLAIRPYIQPRYRRRREITHKVNKLKVQRRQHRIRPWAQSLVSSAHPQSSQHISVGYNQFKISDDNVSDLDLGCDLRLKRNKKSNVHFHLNVM